MIQTLKRDCRHFRGDVPCRPHKHKGVHCAEPGGAVCPAYDPADQSILIIKLGAIGDVIRTTPLLTRLREEHPRARIFWLTLTPDVVPSAADVVLDFSLKSILFLQSVRFDLAINLDKDREACALLDQVHAKTKKGFILKDGLPAPVDDAAVHKFMTGVFDDLNKANTKNYLEEIFEICGYAFKGEQYVLEAPPADEFAWALPKKKTVIGLNTGCGGRWTSRLWSEKNWIALAKRLKRRGYVVVLLGGEQEDERNRKIARASGAKYFGYFPLRRFISLMNRCDCVVTGVTMAMHLTIGLKKKIVLFNNIFNRNEFELYGLGVIVEPEKPCTCFFQPRCTNPAYRCMEHLPVDKVFNACIDVLKRTP